MKAVKKIICVCYSVIFLVSFAGCSPKTKVDEPSDITSIKFNDFSKNISADKIYERIAVLSSKDDARITGFEGEKDASALISKEFENMGLSVEEQEFPITAFKCESNEVKIETTESKVIESKVLTFSKETITEGINEEIVNGNMGTLNELTNAKVKGKLVLIKRGGETFRAKTDRAAQLGALGVIFFDPNSDGAISATLGQPSKIPAVAISKVDGENIIATMNSEEGLKATIKVNSKYYNSTSKNIIGTLKSKKENAKTIIVGAHYDGVDTPAANDNASGISTVIEAARVLADKNMDCNIKFIAFGAEEIGLVGSYNYASSLSQEDIKNTIAMINADMVGIGEKLCVYTVSKAEESLTADLAVACMDYFKYENRRDESTRSDHVAFDELGIPVAYFEYGPFDNYHTDKDTVDKISKEKLANTCNVISSLCYEIGKNPGRFEGN
ncbi:MAG: M20/M25/M40 family metallo-hydrolase [Clostridium sp.]|uniref:M20/M25/M40 family metallo-hydrolase n=1 Tax=Clostridium sp. TaxID=1506 RepID=UPI003033996E